MKYNLPPMEICHELSTSLFHCKNGIYSLSDISILLTSPTMKMYDKAPIKATTPTKTMAPLNELVALKIIPMTIGVTIADKFPAKLNIPPAKPTSSFGAISETRVHVMADIPWEKNANDITAITKAIDVV